MSSVLASVASVAVLLSAYAFGSVEPFWTLALAVVVLALGGVGLVVAPGEPLPRAARLGLVLLAVTPFLGLVPVPAVLREWLGPASAALLAEVGPADHAIDGLSLAPHASWRAATLAAAAALLAVLVIPVARTGRDGALRALLVGGGLVLALFGLSQRLIAYDPGTIYWSIPLDEVGTPFGPYVNRNHFAGAMELLAPTAAGVALASGARGRRALSAAAWAATLVMGVALVATASRGGVLGGLAALGVMVALGRPGGRSGTLKLVAALAGAALLTGGLLVLTGLADEFVVRFLTAPLRERWENRFLVQRDALDVFLAHPLTGTGAGSFESVYPPFQSIDDTRHFSDAHSDWAQFLMERGLVGVAVFGALVAAVVGPMRRVLAADSGVPAARRFAVLGPLAGGVALLVHGFVEVNLHVPSNSLLAVLVLSLAYGSALGADPARTVPEPNIRADDATG